MNNVWSLDDVRSTVSVKQTANKNESQERDRRERGTAVVTMFKHRLESMYETRVAKEYLSVLFRQRGVPSVDMFTSEIMGLFRSCVGLDPGVGDTLRKIVTLGRWSNQSHALTMWTIEPVIASTCIRGNELDLTDAEANFDKFIAVIEPLTTTTHTTTLRSNELRGRWAGWMASKQYELRRQGNPVCMSCNMCGPSIMFAVHKRGSRVIHMMLTPESVRMLSNYIPKISTSVGVTSSLIVQTSTRLKIQPSLDRPRSTSLTVYGNGSMQFSGSPTEIPVLYPSVIELVRTTINSEMSAFLKTMRRADASSF